MSRFPCPREAVESTHCDGWPITWPWRGFTHSFLSGKAEVIRQRRRHLTLIPDDRPSLIYDQLHRHGLRRQAIFSWVGNTGVGSLHSFRDADEQKRIGGSHDRRSRMHSMPPWPKPYEGARATRLPHGGVSAANLGRLRSVNPQYQAITVRSPTSGSHASVRAIRPDVA